jgi:aspartyl-tRNA(Asn)/glutamyl-tRNA(Gln) amidotransferase subunit A
MSSRLRSMMASCPEASVPSGFGATGMPTGLQVVGRTFDDPTVFRIAAAFEEARPWRGARPQI